MGLIGRQYEVPDIDFVHSLLAVRGRQPSVRWEARSRSGWGWKYDLEFRDLMPLQFFLKINTDEDRLFHSQFFKIE